MLNFEEYLVFQEKEKASRKIRREPEIERTREQHEAMFNAINQVTPGVDGVSRADIAAAVKYASSYVIGSLRFPANGLTEEIKGELDKLMDEEAAAIKKWTKAQREASRRVERERTTPAGREAAVEEFKKLFAEADADKDARLNLEEWLSFVEKSEAAKATRGEPSTPKTKEYHTATFNVLNKMTPASEGVSMDDIAAGFNFARSCIAKKLGPAFDREPPLSEEIRKEMVPVLQLDVDFIKSWTPE